MKKLLSSFLMLCCAAIAFAQPKVTTNPFIAQGSTAALGRATFTGTNISERGFCWAEHRNPTIDDFHSTKSYTLNGQLFELSPLEPGKIYFARAYAKTSSGQVGYGEVVKFVSKPQGTSRWQYDYAGNKEENDRIEYAIKHSVELYNAWSSIKGFNINCHYVPGAGAGDGTADCSYGGWMRVSQNSAYQRTGTLLHESNHGVGIGTSSRWWDSNLRANGDRGDWLGERATNMVRFLDNNEASVLHGDATHMWPYGINGAGEDTGSEILYIANVLVTHAVHEDGVAPIDGGGCAPAYTFLQEDTIKYYITNESANYGNGKSYLYDSNGTLKWKEMSAADLTANDMFAWYVEFIPETSYYRLRNANSKKYFTFSGNTIKTKNSGSPSATESFQLLGSREYTTLGEGNRTVTTKGYWIMCGTNTLTPFTLNATTNGATNGTAFSLSLSSKTQRWFILTADEVRVIAGESVADVKEKLLSLIEAAKKIVATPHTENTGGATAAFQAVIDDAASKVQTVEDKAVLNTLSSNLKEAVKVFIKDAYPTYLAEPYDITCLISEPDFSTIYDWSTNDKATPKTGLSIASFYDEQFKFTQTLNDMPLGVYRLNAKAYQCPGDYKTVAQSWAEGVSNVKSYIYFKVTTTKSVVKSIFSDALDAPLAEGSYEQYNGKYIPTDERADSLCFASGLYDNEVVYQLRVAGEAPFGIVNGSAKADTQDKTVFGDFRIYYYGNNVTKEDVTAIKEAPIQAAKAPASDALFNTAGQKVSDNYKGVVIKNGKAIIRR